MRLTRKQFTTILRKQARCADIPSSFFDGYIEKGRLPAKWNLQHSWNLEQMREFEAWLVKYLMKVNKLYKEPKYARRTAKLWLLDYGWRLNDTNRRIVLNEEHKAE